MVRPLFLVLGFLFLSLGFVGIFVPGLPTTPFLLLSAALFFRSSQRLYERLISSRLLGRYIVSFRKNKGMTLRAKLISLAIMWSMIAVSAVKVDSIAAKVAIPVVGVVGTVVMGFCIKTVRKR